MNAYTTKTRARIQPADMARALLTDPSTATLSLATLERIRTYQAEAEVEWLLRQHGALSASTTSRVARLRHVVGAALVRAGQRLDASPARNVSQGTLRTAS